jgi:hypothetical protein
MKTNTKNHAKLNEELEKVNGRSEAHTFTGPQLWKLGKHLKSHLNQWFTLQAMKGITGTTTSGDAMPNAYKYPRDINRVEWVVGSSGNVFITAIKKDVAWTEGGSTTVKFTDEQKSAITRVAIDHAMKP